MQVDMTRLEIVILVLSHASAITLLQLFFVMPYMWQRVMREDWQLKWWMAFRGPWILRRARPPPPPPGSRKVSVRDFYDEHLTPEELAYVKASRSLLESIQLPSAADLDADDQPLTAGSPAELISLRVPAARRPRDEGLAPPRPPGSGRHPRVLCWKLGRLVLRGLEQDVVGMQRRRAVMSWQLEDMHARAARYDNRAEHLFTSLAIIAAAVACFVHGANDVTNSIAPLAAFYFIWLTGQPQPMREIPAWVLAVSGLAILLGFLTYGHVVMRNLGNRITLVSPSRGACLDFATAVTVLVATLFSLPVSTTQCITGATIGVGLANGDWRCINCRLVVWIYFGWLITFPLAAMIAGLLMALILYSPCWSDTGR